MSAKAVLDWFTQGRRVALVDVRGHGEHELRSVGGTCIPLPTLPEAAPSLPVDAVLVFYCQSGLRSGKAEEYMASVGRSNVFSLRGGMSGMNDSDIHALGAMNAA